MYLAYYGAISFCGLSYVICGWRVYGVVFSVVYLTIFVVGVFMVFSFSVVYLAIYVVGVFVVSSLSVVYFRVLLVLQTIHRL